MSKKLFEEFPSISTQQWEEVIVKDLKGADYEKRLVWKTDEGFAVQPYYRAEDLENIAYLDTLPNEFPYTRGYQTESNDWAIIQKIYGKDVKEVNANALHAIAKGANTVTFYCANLVNENDLATMLQGINLEEVGVAFKKGRSYRDIVKWFVSFVNSQNFDKAKVAASIDFDALVFALKQGKFYASKEQDLGEMVEILNLTQEFPLFKVVNINGAAIHNAGATIVQEVGYVLAVANEYLAFATDKEVAAETLATKMQLTLSVGANYFMEIAKLRAVRTLWATLLNAYQVKNTEAYQLTIHSVGSAWNKTIFDPYVNMLRSTTEGMAAAIGGASAIELQDFDTAYQGGNDFSGRMSRNIQIILKEESYLNKVVDPSAGSYYIESLTDAIITNAWALFQEVEKSGGFIAQVEAGTIKSEIDKSAEKKSNDIATRKSILLGTNQYPNTSEEMLDKIEKDNTCGAQSLKTKRGAAAFEEIRLATEKWAKEHHRPVVFLAKMGNLAMRQARAGFITNFFGCAGFQIEDNSGFNTVADAISAANSAKADFVVICSSDEEYATLGVEFAKGWKAQSEAAVFVAGNPTECIDVLKEAGVTDFIHARLNVLETLRKYTETLK